MATRFSADFSVDRGLRDLMILHAMEYSSVNNGARVSIEV